MFADNSGRRAACQGGLVVATTNTVPLLSDWENLQSRKSEVSRVTNTNMTL